MTICLGLVRPLSMVDATQMFIELVCAGRHDSQKQNQNKVNPTLNLVVGLSFSKMLNHQSLFIMQKMLPGFGGLSTGKIDHHLPQCVAMSFLAHDPMPDQLLHHLASNAMLFVSAMGPCKTKSQPLSY